MPTYQTVTGYTLQYRLLPPDYLPTLRAAVRRDLAGEEPIIPTVPVETAPGITTYVPVDVDGDPPDDPDLRARIENYRREHAAWEAKVLTTITRRIQEALTRTIRVEIDHQAVKTVRELYALAGQPLDAYDDAYVMLWYVALADVTDQAAITQSLQGINVGEAASAMRDLFRRQLERQTAVELSVAERPGDV